MENGDHKSELEWQCLISTNDFLLRSNEATKQENAVLILKITEYQKILSNEKAYLYYKKLTQPYFDGHLRFDLSL